MVRMAAVAVAVAGARARAAAGSRAKARAKAGVEARAPASAPARAKHGPSMLEQWCGMVHRPTRSSTAGVGSLTTSCRCSWWASPYFTAACYRDPTERESGTSERSVGDQLYLPPGTWAIGTLAYYSTTTSHSSPNKVPPELPQPVTDKDHSLNKNHPPTTPPPPSTTPDHPRPPPTKIRRLNGKEFGIPGTHLTHDQYDRYVASSKPVLVRAAREGEGATFRLKPPPRRLIYDYESKGVGRGRGRGCGVGISSGEDNGFGDGESNTNTNVNSNGNINTSDGGGNGGGNAANGPAAEVSVRSGPNDSSSVYRFAQRCFGFTVGYVRVPTLVLRTYLHHMYNTHSRCSSIYPPLASPIIEPVFVVLVG